MTHTAENDARTMVRLAWQLHDVADRIDAHVAISPHELRDIAAQLDSVARRERSGMNGLSEEEWSDVLASLPENLDETAEGWELSLVRRTVERIVAARLASVEALADEWEAEVRKAQAHGTPNPLSSKRAHARALRAVLGSDAHTEQKGTGE